MNQKHGFILIGAILVLAVELTAPPTNSDGTKKFSSDRRSFKYAQKTVQDRNHGWSDSNLPKNSFHYKN